MKKYLQWGSMLTLVAAGWIVSQAGRGQGLDDKARAAAIQLFQSLSADQKKLALKDFSDKEKYSEQFPAVTRPGLPFKMLTDGQKTMVNEVLKAMTSDYGAQRCLAVGKQTPEDKRYLNFFGEPSPGKPFAWRIAQHHLTLIYAEFGSEPAREFGPILLGGNPVKDLWAEEEKIILELHAALSPEEVKNIQAGKEAKSTSGAAIGKAGIRMGELSPKARALAGKLLHQRMEVFSSDRRKILESIIQKDGGVDNLRIAVWGSPTKSHLEGGSYHWRIGGPSVVCDWQTAGKNHIHMTVRGRVKG